MLIRTPMAVLVLAVASVPAFASGTIHPTTTEMGYTVHADHAQAGKSRSEVLAEIDDAARDLEFPAGRRTSPSQIQRARADA